MLRYRAAVSENRPLQLRYRTAILLAGRFLELAMRRESYDDRGCIC